jgi:GNAT superfamily N-acetyltransferase
VVRGELGARLLLTSRRPQVPAPGVAVRPGRPTDLAAAELVFDAAGDAYAQLAGSEERARRIVSTMWARPGHSASFEHALVAEIDGEVAGVMIGFPARERYALHRRLLLGSMRHLSPTRWPLLIAGLPLMVLASPRPPRDAYYVGTIAVARHARRRGVGSTLGYRAEVHAHECGFPLIVAHTGTRHAVARRALEVYGLTLRKARRHGYALYAKRVFAKHSSGG